MSIGSVLSWILCGLIVGLIARFFLATAQSMSLLMTILVGIGGALVGGFLYSIVRGASVEPFSLASHNWYGWIVACLGAMLLMWVLPYLFPRPWWE